MVQGLQADVLAVEFEALAGEPGRVLDAPAQLCRTGLVARHPAEDLTPVRRFEEIVRAVALEGTG